jgi:endonuclease/exonuclease/phosphatase family metal-dependent hydrolase
MIEMHAYQTYNDKMENDLLKKSAQSYAYIFLIALHTFFGLHIVGFFTAFINNYYRERPGVSLADVGIYAAATFGAVFLAGFLFVFMKRKHLFLFLMLSICAIRIILQVNAWAPFSLAASALGVVLWMIGIVYFVSLVQEQKIGLFPVFYPSLFFGSALATGVYGMLGTVDLLWQDNPFAVLFVLILSAAMIFLAVQISDEIGDGRFYQDGKRGVFYSLTFFMPLLFLQFYRFQNIAAWNAYAGTRTLFSASIIVSLNLLAFLLIALFAAKIKMSSRMLFVQTAITAACLFGILFALIPGMRPSIYIAQTAAGNLSVWWVLYILLKKASAKNEKEHAGAADRKRGKRPSCWRNTSSIAIGGLLFFIFTFVYYGSYDVNMPIQTWMVPLTAGVLTAFFAFFASAAEWRSFQKEAGRNRGAGWDHTGTKALKTIAVYLMIATLVFPLLLALPPKNDPKTTVAKDFLTVMDYNIHQGFNIHGYLDLESIARVIEGSGADVVALQEVSRGWVVNGSCDTYQWLSDRLDMPYRLFMPASDAIWGNAILSRYPLTLIASGFLPIMDAPLRRSFLFAEVDLRGHGSIQEDISVLSTHVHHTKDGSLIRKKQIEAILEGWGGRKRSVIMGDFNARSHTEEIALLHHAGLIDAQAALGKEDQLTWVHYPPFERIDYIWVTPDIDLANVSVPYSTASDHLPVVLDIR